MSHIIWGRQVTIFAIVAFVVANIFLYITIRTFNLIYRAKPRPFIDEIFHIPQAQKYCNGLFYEWDDKITTLPGLYLLSAGVLVPLSSWLKVNLCTLYWFRFLNVLTAFGNFYVIFKIQREIRYWRKSTLALLQELLSALSLATFPVLYFFSFLYYTDSLATFLVLLMYLLELQHQRFYAALIGFIAVVVRQTNIAWVGFIGLISLSKSLKMFYDRKHGEFQSHMDYFSCLATSIKTTMKHPVSRVDLAVCCFEATIGYALVGLAFFGFTLWNGGLVVGDRSAHQPVVHLPQILYFFFFTVVFGFPFALEFCIDFMKCVQSYKKEAFFGLVLCCLIVNSNTLVHPYLLADNRHYTFYIWKRLYEVHHMAKFAYVLVYMFGAYVSQRLLKEIDFVSKFGFYIFLAICLVPQKLLEFRYFIIPFLMLRIHYCSKNWFCLFLEFIIFSVINWTTVVIFTTRVFFWLDSDEEQHFIW